MIISNNNYSSNINFKAKFFHTDDLYNVAKYATEHGKFDRLNQARKNIDKAHLITRLTFHLSSTEDGRPVASFVRMTPKKNAIVPYSPNDYKFEKQTTFICEKKMNPLKFGLERIIKLGNNAPNNKMYKEVVVS